MYDLIQILNVPNSHSKFMYLLIQIYILSILYYLAIYSIYSKSWYIDSSSIYLLNII